MRISILFFLTFISCTQIQFIPDANLYYLPGEQTKLAFGDEFWQTSEFYYSGQAELTDSSVILHRGGYLTGLTWNGPLIRDNYQIELDARRIEGMDFFCGLTFPVGQEPCSLILGGWGGYTTGLSSINGLDASDNESMNSFIFENGVWYHITLLVEAEKITALVNDYKILLIERTDKTFSIRYEVEQSVPLGIASFNTTGEFRNMTIERL